MIADTTIIAVVVFLMFLYHSWRIDNLRKDVDRLNSEVFDLKDKLNIR